AIKIEPNYPDGAVVYVKDASQSPFVMANLMNDKTKAEYIRKTKEEYETLRKTTMEKKIELTPLVEARKNPYKIDWDNFEAFKPNFIGRKVLDPIKIEDIVPYINWKFFFPAWNLSAKFASVKNISMCGHCKAQWFAAFNEGEREKAMEASKLYDDAQVLLKKIIDLDAEYIKAVFVIGEAYSENDTVYIDNVPFAMLRQQKKSNKDHYLSLADFVTPKSANKKDYLGAFAVTAGAGADYLMNKYKTSGDEYSALVLQSLLDRLAEGATEWLHEKIRKEYWGYDSSEELTIPEMFAVKYSGIRPAVGYPSIPDQSINFDLHNNLLQSDEIGISLTENGLMSPNASVSGLIFAHPEAKYFAIGAISDEQANDYMQRRGMETELSKKYLAANI
ncbi:MAG: methionine synthase, partial [Bacteroidales bacterium]|nr:methionine synthase [Bacteroidales bacterium]